MQLTKFGHACVRLERDGEVLVIDPGTYTEPASLTGATAVLVTHEHADHVDHGALAAAQQQDPSLAVFTHVSVVDQLAEAGVTAESIAVGDTFAVAGFEVAVVGGEHAEIYDGLPGCANLGMVLDGGAVYHPGDALFVPEQEVETLLVPASAPWLKLAEAIDFVRAVGPRRALPIHDAMLSRIGAAGVGSWLTMKGGTDYRRLEPGESLQL